MNQRVRDEDVDSPLCEIRPVKSVMMVVMTGDRGLCGGYNNFILKKVRAPPRRCLRVRVEAWQQEAPLPTAAGRGWAGGQRGASWWSVH